MKITWLGQGGYLLEIAGQRLLVDPYMSDIVEKKTGLKRLIQPPLLIEDLNPDVIFITHDHMDHFDPIALPKIHKSYPKALLAGPDSVIQKARDLNFNPSVLIALSTNESRDFGFFKITATPAFHSDPFAVGCLIQGEDTLIYISGDTLFTQTLVNEIRHITQKTIDMAFICINGKLGNMKWAEAVTVVGRLKPRLAVPMHYGMFAENTENPSLFLDGCEKKRIPALEMIPGKTVTVV